MTFNTSKLTPEQIEQAERDERNTALIRDAVNAAEELGAGSMSSSEIGSQMKATHAQLADKAAYAASRKGCLTPAHIQKDGDIVRRIFFTQADFGAIEAGLFCARCWEQQLFPATPEWVVSHKPDLCQTVKHRSCGWPKGRQGIARLHHEISPLPASK